MMDAQDRKRLGPLLENLSEVITRVLSTDELIAEAIGLITNEGFDIGCGVSVTFNYSKKPVIEPAQLVQNGDVRRDLFTSSSDQKFMRAAKIRIDE
jgi:hypothetical protein